jgi:hypothetical protein
MCQTEMAKEAKALQIVRPRRWKVEGNSSLTVFAKAEEELENRLDRRVDAAG